MIVKHVRARLEAGAASMMPELAGGAQNITARTLEEAWDADDELARWAVEQMARYMAVWTYNLYVGLYWPVMAAARWGCTRQARPSQ